MEIPERNEPCWCGSEKKYKKCHLSRENEKPPTIWEAKEKLRKNFSKKLCLHPEASPTSCSKEIIKAHTVRRSADLLVIAKNNHVYQPSGDISDLHRNEGEIVPKLVGINKASTFYGFCGDHDNLTFTPLEMADLVPTKEQAFLLHYRSLCKELYAKQSQFETIEFLDNSDRGKSVKKQVEFQSFKTDYGLGVKAAVDNLNFHKQKMDKILISKDFSKARFVAIHFDTPPTIMCSGLIQPEYSFIGEILQDLSKIEKRLQITSFTLASTPSGGVAIFSWLDDSDDVSTILVQSLLTFPLSKIPSAIVRFVCSVFENSYFSPDWWDNLEKNIKNELQERFKIGISHEYSPHSSYLAVSEKEDIVSWKVNKIDKKWV